MSLTFQSGESIKQAIYEELQNILNPNKEIRVGAESRMKQLEITEGYGVFLAELIMNQSFDLGLRQLASVMLTKYVEEHWNTTNSDVTIITTDQAKRMIRNILPNGLYDPNSKIRKAVAYTISNIATLEWPNTWTELFDIIVKCLGGNEDSIHGAMQVLEEFTYNLDSQIAEVGPIIISEVYRIFEAEQLYSVETRGCAVKIFKSLFRAINEHVESRTEQNKLLNPILPSIIEKLLLSLSNPDPKLSTFALKTDIIKVLSYMVNEMLDFIKDYTTQILPPIWQLLTQVADVYVKIVVNQSEPNPFQDGKEDQLADFTTMILQMIEFIHSIVQSGKFKSQIKNVLTDLIYIMIVYMQYTEEQIEEWSDNIEKFVEDDQQECNEESIRVSSQEVLENLTEDFGSRVLEPLSGAIARHVNVAEAEKAVGSPHWWKIHEASMAAVGCYKTFILDKPLKFDLSQYLNYVRQLMVSAQVSPYLLGRCLWILSRFSSSNLYNEQTLNEVLQATHASLAQDKPLILRVYAVRSIYELADNVTEVEHRNLFISKLGVYLDGIFAILPHIKNATLSLMLETITIIIGFDVNFAATANSRVVSLTIAIFLKHHDDPFLLQHVQEMLKILCQNPFCLQPLQEKIVPTLVSILNLQGEQANSAMQEIALDVLQTIVKYAKAPLSDQLIEIAFPAAVHCILRTDDHAVMQSGGECLRSFIFVAPHQVCSYKNGEGLNYIMEVTTLLLNPMNAEFTAAFIGRLIITIISKAGAMIGDNIHLLLKAVISKLQLVETLGVTMSLITTFAHLFVTQMEAVLNFLSTVPGPTGEPAMQYVFSRWLTVQHLFYGNYERKVTTMALCKLFEHGVTTKDVRLTSVTIRDVAENVLQANSQRARVTRSSTANNQQLWITIPILVKIFKLLINELDFLKELNFRDTSYQEYSSGGDDNDDGDGDDDDDDDDDTSEKSQSAVVVGKVSDLDDDEDEDDEEDKQLMEDLVQDPAFQINMVENLTSFIQNFSRDDHFREFTEHLSNKEKTILQGIQVSVQ